MIYLILLLGLVLRLIAINQSLWLDEAIGALVVRDMPFHDIFSSFLPVDNHPPLYYLLLKLWTMIFGYSEISLRLPSVIFGIATIYLTYLIFVKITNNKKMGLATTLLLATSQFHIYYSQEARMYSMAAFFASTAFYFYLRILEDHKLVVNWILFSTSITLLIFTDYMPVFILPVFILYALAKKKDKLWWRNLILSFMPIMILGMFWLPIWSRQLTGGKWLMETIPAWKSVAGGANLKQLLLVWIKFSLGRISIVNKLKYYFIISITSIPFILLYAWSLRSLKKYLPVFMWFYFPLGISFIASIFFPIFIYFRFTYVIPAFYLILGFGLESIGKKKAAILFSSIIVINMFSWSFYVRNPSQQREQWKTVVNYIEGSIKKDEIVLFSYPEPFAPYRWYETKPGISYGATDSIYSDRPGTNERTDKYLTGVNGVYYFEYLKEISDPNSHVLTRIYENGFKETGKIGLFEGIGYIYYFTK